MTQRQDDSVFRVGPCVQPARLTFAGERMAGNTRVTVTQGGQPSRELPLHLAIRAHSPTGFEWGYAGSGPAQLALALCVEVVGRDRAERSYQRVKDRLVATIHDDAWMMSGARVLQVVDEVERLVHHIQRSA